MNSAVPVLARGPELHEALSNLVHNAIVYTPAGGHITVMVSAGDGMALAEVRDDGPGIAPARRAEVFERFHSAGPVRQKPARRRAGPGHRARLCQAQRRRHRAGRRGSGTGLRAILRCRWPPAPQG
jgi:two-component system sensor histidine kinase TctE